MMLAPGFQIGPYQIRDMLGQGAMGEVYRAQDQRLGRELALKLLPRQRSEDADSVERFVREARTASALNHPNVVTIYEIGEGEPGRFIAMELVGGNTLRSLTGQPQPIERVAHIGTQVARALAVAHAAGIIHRDIKPENVMVRPDGYVKVLDFGIARLVGSDDGRPTLAPALPTQTGRALGTLRYMSPEQACAEPLTAKTDIFSLGILLHELATGRHPFASGMASDVAVVSAMLTVPPPAASASNPSLPPELDALLARMLDKDPRRRPRAVDVEAVLAELARATQAPAPRREAPPERHTVGREQERLALRHALAEAEGGHGVLLSVAGEPGIGKTTLVEEFLADVSSATKSLRLARGRCSERLAGAEAYLPILEALDALLHGTGASEVTALMKRLAPTWFLQVAPIGVEDSTEGRALVSAQAGSQERMKRELSTFVEELSRGAPVVIFLDDLHWADVSTVDMLAYLGARLGTMRVLVLVTVRPAELLVGKHPFAQLKLDLQARGLCRELALEFLTPDDVRAYVRLEFPANDFPPSFAALIHAKTEGSPLFVADLLRYLRTRGVVANEDGRWTLARSIPAIEHELPESIRGMIQRKIEQLSDDDRRLLTAASVQGYEFDSVVVAGLTSTSPAQVEERLETLEHVYGFVHRAREHELPDRTLDVRYRFVHVLYQNALYAGLTPTRRVSLSAQAAGSLLEHHGDRSAEIATELALLFEAARDPQRAVEQLLVAAQNAARVFASQEAVTLARRALQLLAQLPDTPERAERELLLQSTYAASLGAVQGLAQADVGRAAARAYELWKQLGARPEFFWVLHELWLHYIVAGKLDVAVTIAEELLRLAKIEGDRPLLVAAHSAMAAALHHRGDHFASVPHFQRGLAAYGVDLGFKFMTFRIEPGVALASEYSRALWLLGFPDQALRQVDAAVALANAVPHPEARGFGPLFGAFIHQLCGDVANTLRYAETVLALARERDMVTTQAWAVMLHGWALAMQGRVDDGLAEMRSSLAEQTAAGSLIAQPQFLAMVADACLTSGRYDEALAATLEGLECAAATSDHYWDSELVRLRGETLFQVAGDTAEIEACFRRAMEDARERGAKSLELRAATSAARVWRRRGECALARETLAPVYGWFTEGFSTADLTAARSLLELLA